MSSEDLASEETMIRQLEDQERQAILDEDIATLERFWSEEFIVNNPQNKITLHRDDALSRVKQGLIRYAAFERQIEAIRFNDDIAVVMGAEIVEPVGNTPHVGETVERRYTNIWKKKGDAWRLIARQATIIGSR
jgi:ketosteroid isomerase-like protein